MTRTRHENIRSAAAAAAHSSSYYSP